MNTSNGTALITGASAGIGAVYADRLAKRGYDLILVARNHDRLRALADRLIAETGRSVNVVTADLYDKDDLARVEATLRNDPTITMFVNNAGVGAVKPLLESDVDDMDDVVALNVRAFMRLTYAAAPAFVARGEGTIINIASVVAISAGALNGVYAASKAFVLTLSNSLQHELADKGVRVQAVLPGATATEIWENAGLPWQNLPKEIVMTPEDMVDAALVGLDKGEPVTIPGLADESYWDAFEAARRAMSQLLSNAAPAPRYQIARTAR